MSNILTLVAYHYVRDLQKSRYPEIKGLSKEHFEEQILYLKKYYNFISGQDLIEAVVNSMPLPSCPLLLTFDDGYTDHFQDVFPFLNKEKIPGCFFPSAKCILEHKVLDVNKIHFILASVPNKSILINEINQSIDEKISEYQLATKESYWRKFGISNRHDSAEVMFIKNVLQWGLPEKLRKNITGQLFKKFVTNDEDSFSNELYMNIDQISYMQRSNMYIGSHGFNHYWLNSIPEDVQRKEIELSLEFLKSIGSAVDHWIMCYPHGAYNDSLLSILEAQNCCIGLTTNVGLVNLEKDNPLTFNRLDTNDLPKDSESEPNVWTKKAMNTPSCFA